MRGHTEKGILRIRTKQELKNLSFFLGGGMSLASPTYLYTVLWRFFWVGPITNVCWLRLSWPNADSRLALSPSVGWCGGGLVHYNYLAPIPAQGDPAGGSGDYRAAAEWTEYQERGLSEPGKGHPLSAYLRYREKDRISPSTPIFASIMVFLGIYTLYIPPWCTQEVSSEMRGKLVR